MDKQKYNNYPLAISQYEKTRYILAAQAWILPV